MKYYIKTFGCQMNKSDSERIAAILENNNWSPVATAEQADLVVLNTCSVRQSAEDRVYGHIAKWPKLRRNNPNFIGVVTGCVPAKEGNQLVRRFPEVDLFINIQDMKKLPTLVARKQNIDFQAGADYQDQDIEYLESTSHYQSDFQAFVPISIGCNNFCTYCVVPYARGREKSRPSTDILKECKKLADKGYKEITLLGQNVNSYGQDNEKEIDFPTLLQKVTDIPGDFWIRFITSHPKDMSPQLIKVVAKNQPKVTPYVHLAVQSGSDKILKAMHRKYTSDQYLDLIKNIRAAIPEVMISTDIIVGFPGETATDFLQTADLFKKVRFNMAYISQYSPRPGTVSAKMEDDVPRSEKKLRDKKLTKLLEEISLAENKKDVDKKTIVLLENKKGNIYTGKNPQFKTVKVKSDANGLVGKFCQIKITLAKDWGLEGVIVN